MVCVLYTLLFSRRIFGVYFHEVIIKSKTKLFNMIRFNCLCHIEDDAAFHLV